MILCGHGVSLRVEGGTLVVRDGFTHYPQDQAVHRLFPGDMALPPRIILLDGSGTLSFDVLSWLSEQGIPLLRVKWTGEVATVAGGAAFDREKVEWQRATRSDNAKRLAFAADLIRQKLLASLPVLETAFEPSRTRDVALAKAAAAIDRLGTGSFKEMNDVFAVEGECASAYFATWAGLPVSWTGTSRKPIHESWHNFAGRSSLAGGVMAANRSASHPVNALLNYAYAVKLALLQIAAVAEGYDPMIGIMHNGRLGSPGWALDMIEPHRPIVDGVILSLIRDRRFATADFNVRRDGVCRLSPQLARAVATIVSNLSQITDNLPLPGRRTRRRTIPSRTGARPLVHAPSISD
jgi:CRISPR-associated endonuclease Cas1